jgi:hypothetical protein
MNSNQDQLCPPRQLRPLLSCRQTGRQPGHGLVLLLLLLLLLVLVQQQAADCCCCSAAAAASLLLLLLQWHPVLQARGATEHRLCPCLGRGVSIILRWDPCGQCLWPGCAPARPGTSPHRDPPPPTVGWLSVPTGTDPQALWRIMTTLLRL